MAHLLSHWGLARPVVRDGRLVAMEPSSIDPNHSSINDNYIAAATGPMRITQPMIRKGYLRGDGGAARGEDGFVATDWDTAIARLVADMGEITARHSNEAIFGGSYGWASAGRFHHAQSQIHRFLNLAGGYVRSVNTYSHAAAEVALPHIIGSQDGLVARQTPWELIVGHTELFVSFGGMPAKNAQVSAGGVVRHTVPDHIRAARASGTRFVNISPLRDDMDAALDAEWIPIRPNSDVALMLGMAHVLESEGRTDTAFLARHATGYDRFRDYLTGKADGQPKSPEWAEALTGIPADRIADLARRTAENRTMLNMAFSLQRADHGEQPVWMLITLAAMLGQIGLPGGGFGIGYSASSRIGNIDLPFSWPALPQFQNPVRTFIPVARLTDALESPRKEFNYNGGRYTYPDIRMIWWAGGNPFHHQQDLRRLHKMWKRPELVVVQEPLWNAIARHADIILPCTLPLERNDLGIPKAEPCLVAMPQSLSPPGQARNDFDILAHIADEMGFGSQFTEDRDEMAWVTHLYEECRKTASAHGHDLPGFQEFWEAGEVWFDPGMPPQPLLSAFRNDPDGAPLATPSGRIELFSQHVADFGYADCPGMATWIEPGEWLGNAGDDALHLISNQPAHKLHSQLDLGVHSRKAKVAGREAARLHPADAARRGISDGDVISVSSPRGTCLAGAVISADVNEGVIQMATGAWLDLDHEDSQGPERHGNVNVLTRDVPTSQLAQGPVSHTALVRVEKFKGTPPAVRAFTPPEIENQEQE